MAKPIFHAISSVKKFGGKVEDYIAIHNLMDSSKGAIPDNRHRALTHNSWFLSVILEKIFGTHLTNSDGKVVAVREVGEQHVLEDFNGRFIPTAQDYIQEMEMKNWMNNGREGTPTSHQKIEETKKTIVIRYDIIPHGNFSHTPEG